MATAAIFSSLRRRRSPSLEAFLAPVDLTDVALVQTLAAISNDLVSKFSHKCFHFQRRNSRSLIRKIEVFLVLLDYLKDSTSTTTKSASASASSPSTLPSTALLCFKELYLLLYRSKILLHYCAKSSKLWLLLQNHSISGHFHDLSQEISTLLDVFPLKDVVELSDDVREQVELLQRQARRSRLFIDKNDESLRIRFFNFLDVFEKGEVPNSEELRSFFVGSLGIKDAKSCRVEIEFLEEQIVNHEGDVEPTVSVLNGFVALTRYCRFLLFGFEEDEVGLGFGRLRRPRKGLITQEIAETFITVPKDFCCPISLDLMRDPVIISTGQTYERSSIARWMEEGHCNCPKTGQMLVHNRLVPNRALRSLIMQWCIAHGVPLDPPETMDVSTESFAAAAPTRAALEANRATAAILIQQLANGSEGGMTVAAREIRLLAKTGKENRAFIAEAGAIPHLRKLLLSVNPVAQENSVTAMLNLSIYDKNKSRIMDEEGCLGSIVEVLRFGHTTEARENAAATLFSLSAVHDYKKRIADEGGAVEALAGLLRDGTPRGKKDAVTALFNLSTHTDNCVRMIEAGAVTALVGALGNEGVAEEAAGALALIVRQPVGAEAVGKEEMAVASKPKSKSKSKPNPNRCNSKPSLANSVMTQSQLIDSLTSHISLYHSRTTANSDIPPLPNSNPRSSILKWFSSLTVHQRQAHITAVDSRFVRVLVDMLGKVRTHGHGCFIVLPDIPSRDDLPSFCFKKSRGLLSRVAESNRFERLVSESVRLFSSTEGESVGQCSCSVRSLDTATVSEEFVEDLERFVETMDEVSNGGFLRGEESELGSDWVELEWLKARGYYTMEAFVVNRLEVALRLAWLNCNNGRKRGVKLKEKASAAAGVAANVYWRKRGCVDWWRNLDAAARHKILTVVLGKSAKSLTHEILKEASTVLEDEMWLFSSGAEHLVRYNHTMEMQRTIPSVATKAEFGLISTSASLLGKPTSLANVFNSLLVLHDIIMMISSCHHGEYDKGELFFSKLGSVCTISDCILRKLRGFLKVVSLDCTKLELLEEGIEKSLPYKSKEKPGACSRRKKGRTRNMKRGNPIPRSRLDDFPCEKSLMDLDCANACKEKADLMESQKIFDIPQGKETCRETSTVQMEHAQGMVVGKVQNPARKGRKDKNKMKKSGFNNLMEVRKCENSVMEDSSLSAVSQNEAPDSGRASDNSTTLNATDDNKIGNDILASNSSLPCSVNGQGDYVNGSSESFCNIGSECYNLSNDMIEKQTISLRLETLNCNVPSAVPALGLDNVLSNEDSNIQNCESRSECDVKSTFPNKQIRAVDIKDESVLVREQESVNTFDTGPSNSSEHPSNEWPNVTPVYFPSVSSHLPAATDRLHLDVGRNWHNHFQQSFIPTMHHARNSPIEGGCNPILSRPLSMSLDWPPVVRSTCGLAPSVTYNYDSGFISRRQSTFPQSLNAHSVQLNAPTTDDERKYSGDFTDSPDLTNAQELADECDSHWISEEEVEVHAVSGIDYNQYFGGGVMYWNPSDLPGTGFSRPPSLSSDDSSWAWRDADMIRAVDDMVAYSSSYSTNGLTSPTAASFSSFDPLGPGHQPLGYVIPGNEIPGKMLHSSSTLADAGPEEDSSGSLPNLPSDVEGKTGDSLPYPILPPIVVPNWSRGSRDFKRSHDHKSPCVPSTRREHPRIKRPPSPVVLCVPRAPCPPPPSPVSDSRKLRGFPTVRSGSSSPRQWGVRGWYNDGNNLEDACLRMDGAEVVWPSWRNNNLSARSMIQPLPAALLQDRLIAMSQLARDQEHPDVAIPLQPPELQCCPSWKTSISLMHSHLRDEIDSFCKQVAAANMARKPYINWAVKRVTRSLQVLWPRSQTHIFGSNSTGLSLPTSDVDLVVCLPPVRNLEPIKEAGILEGRNGIKETCLQHAARYLANQEWVKNDSLKTVENTAIPIIKLVVEVPHDLITSSASNVQSPKEETTHMNGEQGNNVYSDTVVLEDSALPKCAQIDCDTTNDSKSVCLDISFKSPSHTGLQTTKLVKELTEQFLAATPLALVLKQFLADRSLDQSYSGGLSSHCLVLLITRFLQHEHHLGRPINQNFGSLLMDFLYFFGNVFDPRQMRISVRGSGVYMKRERGCSIDPIHIDDPLYPTNNVGRNCFRIHQCIKAFSEAYSVLENELMCIPDYGDTCSRPPHRLLPKIIPSIDVL